MSQQIPKLENLGWRERQILEAVYRLEDASVSEILKEIPEPPTYSAVRAILNMLVQKGYLETRRDKVRYLYRPVVAKKTVRISMLRSSP
ncbi:MAG: BlaI/MecI/CopY family transcriptional regulator [Thermoguttaceae bacterium]